MCFSFVFRSLALDDCDTFQDLLEPMFFREMLNLLDDGQGFVPAVENLREQKCLAGKSASKTRRLTQLSCDYDRIRGQLKRFFTSSRVHGGLGSSVGSGADDFQHPANELADSIVFVRCGERVGLPRRFDSLTDVTITIGEYCRPSCQ
jgi:hypothetical protein